MITYAIAACAALQLVCPGAEQVNLGALTTRIHEFAERPITVCGILWRRSTTIPSEYIFWEGEGTGFAIHLDVSGLDGVADNRRACLTGIARRRDGISVAEVRARGLGEETVADGFPSPGYVLYPVSRRGGCSATR